MGSHEYPLSRSPLAPPPQISPSPPFSMCKLSPQAASSPPRYNKNSEKGNNKNNYGNRLRTLEAQIQQLQFLLFINLRIRSIRYQFKTRLGFPEMVAGTEVVHQSISVLDVKCRCVVRGVEEVVDVTAAADSPPPSPGIVGAASELVLRASDAAADVLLEPIEFIPSIRSGSFSDIGPRRYMEDEHICIDDLSAHLGSPFTCPTPSAFYGVFDGHGGPDAAAYIKRHAIRLFFEDPDFPQASEADKVFVESVESSIRRTFFLADHALADDCTISTSSGTTALTALVFGRLLLVANAGDCRAVLCRKGTAIEMSQDHRPIYTPERERVESSGGYIDDGYLNGVLSVSRALGDWDVKLPRGSSSPLISEPEFKQTLLTDDDEFLIIGCDGIWDVMSSQHAVSIVRRGLRRHDNPQQCARELVMEALTLNTFDNLTVIVVCFSSEIGDESLSSDRPLDHQRKGLPGLRCCSLSTEALCNLKSWLDNVDNGGN